jgi:DNA helicase-2/ATP-dependent DNA helicase PcrA
VRRNSDADPLIKSLNMHSIPWKFTGNKGLYDREEIMFLISFLRVITNPENNYSLWFLCSSDIYNMDPMDLTKCNIFASKKNLPLYYIFEHIDEFENISDKDIAKRIVDDIKRYNKEIYRASTGELLYKFINESSYLKYLMDNSKGEEIQNIAKFFDIIANIGNVLHENRVYSFVSHLDMLIKAGDNPPVAQADYDSDSVNILTIHKAKGLEFRVVFMVGLVSGIFPSIYRKDTIELPPELIKDITVGKDFHKKEERRLFYVGMTRAKDELYLTSASDYGGERKKKISEFVSEALNLTKDHIILKASPLEIINRYGKVERDRKELPIPEDEIITLSYYQIDDYLTCPLKYKFIHIWKMPIFKHFSIIYGKSLHDAIQEYNRSRMKGENMSEEELISIFEKIWVSEGFLSREHEEERFEAGKRALREFYRKEALSDEKPSYIEEEFTFYLDNNRITGRWDRIDINNEEVTIIDYKSSDIRSEDDAIKRTKGSLQLSIYALAYRERFGRLPDWVELRFIETGFRGKIKKSEKDIEKVKNEIKKVSSGIRLRKFLSRPNYINCRYCACLEICPERSR